MDTHSSALQVERQKSTNWLSLNDQHSAVSDSTSKGSNLELLNVTKLHDQHYALREISLQVRSGEFVAIIGPSGCGKTTLLRCIAGLDVPTQGEIYLRGKNVVDLPIHQRNVRMVWQSYALFPHLNVYQNIEFGLKLKKMKQGIARQKIEEVAEMLHLNNLLNRRTSQLSGGQKQRVAIARAIVTQPGILLLDEPLSALDAHLRLKMQTELRRLNRALGISFVYVTHNQSEAFSMADRVVVMNQGCIEQIGSPSEIYAYPQTQFVASFVGNSTLFHGRITAIEDKIAIVNCPQGIVQASLQTSNCRPGDEVAIAIPADKLYPVSQGLQLENQISVMPSGREFMGSQIAYYFETATGQTVKMIRQEAFDQDIDWSADSAVQLFWQAKDTAIMSSF